LATANLPCVQGSDGEFCPYSGDIGGQFSANLDSSDAMHKLGQANRGEHRPLVASCGDDLLQKLRYVIASAFSGDDHAGVQD
jgi:hypothetical protein